MADQLAPKREEIYHYMREKMPDMNIETYCADILPGNNGNLEHVCNWALRRARELQVDALCILQDYIWLEPQAADVLLDDLKTLPLYLHTGNISSSKGPFNITNKFSMWDIFARNDSDLMPPLPHEPDNRVKQSFYQSDIESCIINNHAWEMNWAAIPHYIINSEVNFDEDFDRGFSWGNTQYSFNVARHFVNHPLAGGKIWWNVRSRGVSMPHREFFPETHELDRKLDNGPLFWFKNPDLLQAS